MISDTKNIQDFLFKMKDLGVNIYLNNNDLKITAPKNFLTSEMINEIKCLKLDIIEFLKSSKIANLNESYTLIKPAIVKEFYPLSSAQKRLFLLHQMNPDSVAYNMPFTISIGKETNKTKIESVFHQLISRHESFRTGFEVQGEVPIQRIHEKVDFKIAEYSIEKSEKQALQNIFIQPFCLFQPPLLRVALVNIRDEDQLLMIDMHHIISDGFSFLILEEEFKKLYNDERLSLLKLQYKDYSEWQNSEQYKVNIKEQEGYWLKRFAGEIPILNLPLDYIRPNIQKYEGATVNFALSENDSEELKKKSESNGITLYMSILSAFTILLSKLSGQKDIIIGCPIAGRNHADLEHIVGMFVNALAIRISVYGNNNLKELIENVKQNTLEAFDNQYYSFDDLVEKVVTKRDTSRNPIFDVIFNLLNQKVFSGDLSNFDNQKFIHASGTSKFDLNLTAVEYGKRILFSIEYSTNLFMAESIERFAKYFLRILKYMSGNWDLKIYDIDMMCADEKHKLLYEFNNTQQSYPKDRTINQLFEQQVELTPHNKALIFEKEAMTYCQLNNKANQIAEILRNKGVVPDTIVGLMFEKSFEMIISILAILKSGGAYLPIDPEYPIERKSFMLKDSETKILLTNKNQSENFDFHGEILNIDDHKTYINDDCSLEPINKSSDLAYILYTSGTTGKPKGVMIEHRNVIRLVKEQNYAIFNQNILQTGAIEFDASTFEIWGSLLNGMSLCLVKKDEILSPDRIKRIITEANIGTIWLTAPLFNQLIQTDITIFCEIKNLLVGGDVLSPKHINKLREKYPSITIINGYGPTENTTFSTTFKVNKEYVSSIPIGKPISNSTAYIVDKNTKIVPVGVYGELLVGGDGLARGYLNRDVLNREKFILWEPETGKTYTDEDKPETAVRVYRTGDLCRWLPDGNIEFLGRMDNQVKIRGYRIELGEIENALLKHDHIKECHVIVREEKGEKYLCAYIILGCEIDNDSLNKHLLNSLPNYMVPSCYVRLNLFPLNFNGKIDKEALPKPEVDFEEYVSPQNDIEKKICKIWSEVLGINEERISTRVEFFTIGGNSLKLIRLLSLIKNTFVTNLTIYDIFRHPTVFEIAQLIDHGELVISLDAPFVKINRNANKNVYCFPPSLGLGIWCSEIAQYINDFVFTSFNFVENESLPDYYADIIINDSQSDKILMGYSAGGNLAFEVAKTLELKNCKVTDIIFIDSNKWIKERNWKVYSNEEMKSFKIFKFLEDNDLDFYKEKVLSIISGYSNYVVNANNSDEINANIHNIVSEERIPNNELWAISTRGKYIEYRGSGSHTEMISEPYLRYNAELLNSILNEISR